MQVGVTVSEDQKIWVRRDGREKVLVGLTKKGKVFCNRCKVTDKLCDHMTFVANALRGIHEHQTVIAIRKLLVKSSDWKIRKHMTVHNKKYLSRFMNGRKPKKASSSQPMMRPLHQMLLGIAA